MALSSTRIWLPPKTMACNLSAWQALEEWILSARREGHVACSSAPTTGPYTAANPPTSAAPYIPHGGNAHSSARKTMA
jgi:hypothetical protein